MAAIEFSTDITLDSESFMAARGQFGERDVAVQYVPKVKSALQDELGQATLDPLDYTTWHRGAGASRSVAVEGMVAYGENVWTGDPGLVLPGPEVTSVTLPGANGAPRPDGIAEADGHIFVVAGRYVFRIPNGSGVPTQDLDLGLGHVGYALKRWQSSLFLSNDLSLYERPDGGAWTNALTGAASVLATGALEHVYWSTGGTTGSPALVAERLVGQFGTRGLRYCSADPRNSANWTPAVANPAIDCGGTITRFVATRDHLYIATTSGLRDLDASGLAPNLVPEAEWNGVLSSGGLAAMAADGKLYYSAGYQLWRVQVTGLQYAVTEVVTPMAILPNETPVGGYGTAIVPYLNWRIYALFDPVNYKTWLCFGRDASMGQLVGFSMTSVPGREIVHGVELGPMSWNISPITLPGWKVTALWVSGLASDGPRLWMFGQDNLGNVSARWAPLWYTTPYADLMNGRARRFASSNVYLVEPAEDKGDDALMADVEEIQLEAEGMAGGNALTVSGRREAETTYTQLAKFTSGPRSLQTVQQAFVSQRPQFRIDWTTTPVSPAVMRRLTFRWLPNPDLREVRVYTLRLGRAEGFVGGARLDTDPYTSAQHLVNLVAGKQRVAMVDEKRKAYAVRVLMVKGPSEVEGDTKDEIVLAMQVTLAIFGNTYTPFVWDSGVTWNDGVHGWGP